MKQTITFEQAKSLWFKERENLFAWFKKKMDPAVVLSVEKDKNNMRKALTHLSIGDLIQFIEETVGVVSIDGPFMSEGANKWSVCAFSTEGELKADTVEGEELIDVLWAVTRELIKEGYGSAVIRK